MNGELRVGQAFDVHRIGIDPHRPMVLGGCRFEGLPGLVGHSDGDAIAHAVADAMLGAAGLGDIGQHFPDTDELWRDADSMELLRTVVAQLAEGGWRVEHVDATVMLERPKLADRRDAIRESLASVLGSVNVKFTTGERMGFVGREEGIAALAVATLEPAGS